ncbi:MAG: choice-of-anchor D domain-containing protein [Acidobacteriaceae bacterium]
MRSCSALLIVVLGLGGVAVAQTACTTGLCLQLLQTSCPGNATTSSISGVVYAPNGTDPLPNVTVYIPNDTVPPFTPGVSCPVVGAPPSGSPLVGTTTDVNGKFTLIDVPVGANIPLVIVSGRWRRQLTIPGTVACTNTALPANFAVMPQNQSQGDIPLIAIATGSADQAECVLLKMGISLSEFTDPGGGGRINLFGGGGADGSGVTLDTGTQTQASLMGNYSTLQNYDVLMLPCEGSEINKPDAELQNLIAFANAGGRIYTSHFGYSWMFTNPLFDSVANWIGGTRSNSVSPDPGVATVNTSFTDGQTLATWLQNVGASTSPGQMEINTLRVDQNGVNAPTQSWLTLNNSSYGNPVMQFVWDTPIAQSGQTGNQCGRVLFNEYHVENGSTSPSTYFPNECDSAPMTPQEKLLEYMLFELTSEGGQPSLAPLTQDFGSEAVGYPSAPQTFTWTNNSSFASQVSSAAIIGTNAGDFAVTSNNCGTVAGGASCQITVVFTPTALGPRSGTLVVVSGTNTLTASLTGTGVPGFTLSPASLNFGSLDVGASATKTLTLSSNATGPVPVPVFSTTGPFTVSTAACGSSVAALASCQISVTFLPTTTGAQSGTAGVNSSNPLYSGLNATLSGNGIDFTISLSPTSGSVVAGDGTATTATLTPIAGFNAPLSLNCPAPVGAGVGVAAPACALSSATIEGGTAATAVVSFTTTSQYTVIGYGSYGGRNFLWLIAAASGWLMWRTRRSGRAFLPHLKFEMWGTLLLLLGAMGLGLTGCTGKLPSQNPSWTTPGTYTVTVSATDGFLVHSATYSLKVSAK